MRLINNISTVRNYVSVSENLNWETLKPYISQSERKYIKPLVGSTVFTEIVNASTDEQKQIKELFAEASANFGVLRGLPVVGVAIANTGITTTANEDVKVAEWYQVKDLKRTLQTVAYEALDDALELLENTDAFPAWKTSEYYTVFKELLVYKASIFQQYFNINTSRRTYLALKPFLFEVEQKRINPLIDTATIEVIKTASNAIAKKVQSHLRAAIVAYTIADIAEQTTFDLTASGLFYRWDLLPGEKAQVVPSPALMALTDTKRASGDEYLKLALNLIKDNGTIFPDYVVPEASESSITKYKSNLSL